MRTLKSGRINGLESLWGQGNVGEGIWKDGKQEKESGMHEIHIMRGLPILAITRSKL